MERSLIQEIKDAYRDPPRWALLTFWGGTWIVTIVATIGAIVKDGEFPTPFGTLIIVLVLLLLPMLVYWIALTMFLTAVFVLGMVFQLISWAGRAWRGEPLFDD